MLPHRLLKVGLAICACFVFTALNGCGSGDATDKRVSQNPNRNNVPANPPKPAKPNNRILSNPKKDQNAIHEVPDKPPLNPKDNREPPRILGDLVKGDEGDKPFLPDRLPVDDDRLNLHEIRKVTSKHLVLYTDLPSSKDVDELPKVFDLAVPRWCEYFKVDPNKVTDWRMTAFLVKDKTKFQAAAVFPDDLPPFQFGFQRGWEFWLYEQLTDEDEAAVYYQRHLLLHEGTHGFMNFFLGGAGPLWYMEGMAELLATHRWDGEKLKLNYMPKNRADLPYWGRVKVIKDDLANNQAKSISEIMTFQPGRQLKKQTYAWCWALTTFFDNHPAYQDRFRALQQKAVDRTDTFSFGFFEALKPDEPNVSEDWMLFVIEMDYGYDGPRAAVLRRPSEPLPAKGASVEVAADRGWQSTGVVLEEGKTYEISASGRYQVGNKPKPWWCEPNGVTIDYYRGQPLGKLMYAVRNDNNPFAGGLTPLAAPMPIGIECQIVPQTTGTLYLRINESPAGLHDNAGKLTAKIAAQ